jgi:hypothetical protein
MRSPRRARFATPFVVTVALTGCASAPPPEEPHWNPPPEPTKPTPGEPFHTINPPPPLAQPTAPPVAALPLPTDPAHVIKDADGSCREFVNVHCPAGVSCNPPPPHPVQCPPGK